MAHLNEQVQQEKSHKERELKEARETHHSQINNLQEKISSLVGFDLVPFEYLRREFCVISRCFDPRFAGADGSTGGDPGRGDEGFTGEIRLSGLRASC